MTIATTAAVQAQLGTSEGSPLILRDETINGGTITRSLYVQGGATYPGRTRWIPIADAEASAATQATAVRAALLA